MSNQPEVRIGQIWKEVDPRFCRFVRVNDISNDKTHIFVRTVHFNDKGKWVEPPKSRGGWAAVERFNGKRCGYAYDSDDLFYINSKD